MLSALSSLGKVVGWITPRSCAYFLRFFFFLNKGIQFLNSRDVGELLWAVFEKQNLVKEKCPGWGLWPAQPPLGPASFLAFARGPRFPPPTVVQNGACYTGGGGTLESVVQCPAPQTHSACAPPSLEQQSDCGLYSLACNLESLGGF